MPNLGTIYLRFKKQKAMTNKILLIIGNLLIVYGLGTTVIAQGSSPGYRIDESYIGPGGSLESASPSYKEGSSLGDSGVGSSSSGGYTAVAGFNTSSEPRLRVVIGTPTVAFGTLSRTSTATATATFNVLNYTAHGYGVFTVGTPPSIPGHILTGLNPTTGSSVGNEQFGINLKANTGFGLDPVQVPSGSFSFGIASSGYDSTNNFRYVNGEQIAQSNQASGETDYTVSYIVNISTTTPSGKYIGQQGFVVVGSY